MRVVLTNTQGVTFDAQSDDGHRFVVDASAAHGGQDLAPSPKRLLLAALAGCTGIDVAGILAKMRQPYTKLAVSAEGEQTDTHPKVFRSFHVTFDVEGEVDPKKLWRAVSLSRDQYCGVSAMLEKHAPIETVVRLNGVEVPEPS